MILIIQRHHSEYINKYSVVSRKLSRVSIEFYTRSSNCYFYMGQFVHYTRKVESIKHMKKIAIHILMNCDTKHI
jgi:hypothetical protein